MAKTLGGFNLHLRYGLTPLEDLRPPGAYPIKILIAGGPCAVNHKPVDPRVEAQRRLKTESGKPVGGVGGKHRPNDGD